MDDISLRLKNLETRHATYNDELYYIIGDCILTKLIPDLDFAMGTSHTVAYQAGGGPTGSDTTAVHITVPRERREGVWNSLARFFSPRRPVITIRLAQSLLIYSPPYEKYVRHIFTEYDESLRNVFGFDLEARVDGSRDLTPA